MKDDIFNEPFSAIDAFAFDEKVVAVFPDMIKRSVPGYDTILKGMAMMAMQYVKPDSRVFDLGSSLGAVSLTIDQSIGNRNAKITAVDNSLPMVQGMQQILSQQPVNNDTQVIHGDVMDTAITDASFVVSNFTLQFMPQGSRRTICQRVFDGLNEGGAFVLSEKVKSTDLLIDFYHGYKKVNGYSDLEIAQKRQALEDTLKPDSLKVWKDRLHEVGFSDVTVWFQAFNFISLVAVK